MLYFRFEICIMSLDPGMWIVEVEVVEAANFCGSGKRVWLPLRPFIWNVKN